MPIFGYLETPCTYLGTWKTHAHIWVLGKRFFRKFPVSSDFCTAVKQILLVTFAKIRTLSGETLSAEIFVGRNFGH